ncbi:sensor histidine kinase [Actinomadura parmotrematis]|uniref:histidine kinase n=1 Tax=Actinomadura parmotrematis TaxID=2864039 RepID=A0ABS7G2L9_9ACTN|nr:HAMP domain-containing sensor histidine kinase [Actinomadura parmotrematis]MBW8485888.1 HAMP domain-containing histidine kinase [Actinomadura parmotrematis]
MTLGVTALAVLLNIGLSTLVLFSVRSRADDYEREQTIAAALRTVSMVKRDDLPKVLNVPGVYEIQVLDAARRVVAASDNLRGAGPIAAFQPSEADVYGDRVLCPAAAGPPGCMSVIAFRVFQDDGVWTIYAAERAVPWYVSPTLVLFLVGLSLAVVVPAAFATWRTVTRTLAPVDAIRAELAEISATSSGRRVPVPPNHDEIRKLAETANATLDRLDGALEQQRRFTSDASHDLRSPIAAARVQVEEALLYPDETDWPRVGHGVLDSLERLQAIVTDLLDLARLDAHTGQGHEPVDLSLLVAGELDRTARGKQVRARIAPGVRVRGDRLRLVRLLTNLLDNAERHADSTINVRVVADRGRAVLEVRDDGEGIAPADREVVFQRFARLKASRDRDAGGTGLGLPIARQVATAHGGTLTIEDSPRGARFVLRLPLLDAAEPEPREPQERRLRPGAGQDVR